MVSTNSLSSRMVDNDSDKWGRWTYQTYQGKGNVRVSVFSIYQVVDSRSALQGHNTVASQQQALLEEASDPIADPRRAFCRDLQATVKALQTKGHDVSGITELATECNLVDVMAALHSALPQPTTYMRGRKRIDYILASP